MKTTLYKENDNSTMVKMDFADVNARQNWRVSNDNVMGGLSKGGIELSIGKVIFNGDISLENNGGFSAVFHAVEPMIENLNHIMLDFLGDGNCYQMRLVANNHGKIIYYYHEFTTQSNEQQKVILNLADFQATFRGKKIIGAPKVVSQNIEEIGFLLTKKQAGPFSLSLFSLSFIAL
ncbi:CIA30 family protein [Psychromonas sp. KJ10-10]|uniref:CIA30 family protein n=1 Tax=Psychromonas sp. KJ10-10 TaxID=3391823 RepID=UPI0039B45CE1